MGRGKEPKEAKVHEGETRGRCPGWIKLGLIECKRGKLRGIRFVSQRLTEPWEIVRWSFAVVPSPLPEPS